MKHVEPTLEALVVDMNEAIRAKDHDKFELADRRHRDLAIKLNRDKVFAKTGHGTDAMEREVAQLEEIHPNVLKRKLEVNAETLAKKRTKLLAINSQAEDQIEEIEAAEYKETILRQALAKAEWYLENDPKMFDTPVGRAELKSAV